MIIFHDESGRYTGHATEGFPAPAETLANMRSAGAIVTDVPPFPGPDWWFPNGAPTVRPKLTFTVSPLPIAPGESVRLEGIPAGTQVHVSGEHGGTLEADGEPIEITFTIAGIYSIGFEAWPHRPESLHIHVQG